MSLLSLPRAGSRSRRLVVCGAAAAIVLIPATAQAETTAPASASESTAAATSGSPAGATATDATPAAVTPTATTSATPTATTSAEPTSGAEGETTELPTTTETASPTTSAAPSELPLEPGMTFPEIDPAVLGELFTPICDTGTLTGLTLQLDQLSGLLEELQASGFPIPEEAFSELPSGTIDIPLDDTTLGELATELNAASAELGELGLTDADIEAALAELPAGIRGDVETLLGELQTGTVQPATLRALLMEIFPCPVEAPVAPVGDEDVVYPGYAPTGGTGSDGGSPLALLGSGAALLAGGGLFAASALRSRAARA